MWYLKPNIQNQTNVNRYLVSQPIRSEKRSMYSCNKYSLAFTEPNLLPTNHISNVFSICVMQSTFLIHAFN